MNIFDLYTDYLQITSGLATATGLSSILDKAVPHDQVTQMLANHESDSKALWRTVKSLVREHEHVDGCLIFDDTILHKPHTDENEVICWHHDHATGKKRWSVEEYHKSFKQNTLITKSSTKTVKTQCAHIFAAIVSYTKLERYKFSTKLNHFALKSKLFLNAAKAAFRELELIKLQHAEFEKSSMTA